MTGIIIAAAVVSIVGLLLGLFLGFMGKKFAVEVNQKEIDEAMISSMKSKVRPLRTWSFFWRELICCIPIINLVVFFVQAFADGVNFNSRSYARAKLIKFMIITLLLLAAAILVLIYYDSITEFIRGAIDYLYSYIHQA